MAISELKIKNVASFSAEGVEINDIKKLNFFLGFNGNGKSTIARFIYNLFLSKEVQSEDFSSCQQIGFNPDEEVIFVYNEDFKKRNFIDKDTLDGIFSLNERSAFVESEIKRYEEHIVEMESRKQLIETRKKKVENCVAEKKKDLI